MNRLVAVLLLLACPTWCWAQTTLSSGLIYFMELSFTNTPVPAWIVQVNDDLNATLFQPTFDSSLGRFVFDRPGGVRFNIAGPQHLFVRPGDNATWGFIGVGANQLFRATPQNGSAGSQLMMGIASTGLSGLFVDNKFSITMSVAGISNPGEFSYYINDNTPNSATGSSATPLFSTLLGLNTFVYDGGTQNFYNMAFSAPGLYNVDFQFNGTRTAANGGGTFTSPFYRYTFEVATFAVPEPSTWALLGCGGVGGILTLWYLRRRQRRELDRVLSHHQN